MALPGRRRGLRQSSSALLLATSKGAARSSVWRGVSRAGAATASCVVLAGVIGLVAFEPLFTIFHQVFFPAGGWAFDPTTQRLVQLYPFAFWQIAAAAFGLLALCSRSAPGGWAGAERWRHARDGRRPLGSAVRWQTMSLLSLDEARARMLRDVLPLSSETVPLAEAWAASLLRTPRRS